MADQDVVVKFGAQIEDLKDKFDQVGGLFKELTDKFAILAVAIGGGEAFKEFIDKAQEVTGETVKLSKALGIGSDEAGSIRTAIEDVGGSADMYSGAFTRFSRQLANNGETMKQYGVNVDGVRNGTVSGTEAFQQALQSISSYKAGVDQSQAAMKLFGRNVGDVQTLLKVTPALLEEARKKNEDLNLNITVDSVEASKRYSLAMHDVNDVLEGIEKTIGEAVIPMFTQMAQRMIAWGPDLVAATKVAIDAFVDIFQTVSETIGTVLSTVIEILGMLGSALVSIFGTSGEPVTAMGVFKTVLETVKVLFIGVQVTVELLALAIKTGFQVAQGAVSTFMEVVDRLFHLDWRGANAAVKAGVDERNQILADAQDKAFAIANKGNENIANALGKNTNYGNEGKGSKQTEYTPPSGTKRFKPVNKGADKEASAQRAIQRAEEEAELALQKEYLADAQKLDDDAYAHGLVTTQEYYDDKLKIALAAIDAEIDAKLGELAATNELESKATTPEARLKAQAQEIQLQGAINVLLVKRGETIRANDSAAQDALKALADANKQFESDQAKAAGGGRVAAEKAELDQMKALRQIDAADASAVEQRMEDESYAITVKALQDKASLIKGNELEQQKAREALQLETEAAERDHQAKLTAISNAAEQERQKYAIQAEQQSQNAFSTFTTALLTGTQTIANAFKAFGVTLGNMFANLISQKFAEKIFDATGLNKAIGTAVTYVTEGIGKMVSAFVSGEAIKNTASQAGALLRQGVSAAEALFGIGQKTTETTAAVVAEGTEADAAAAGDIVKSTGAETASIAGITAQQTETTAAVLGYSSEAAVAAMASVAAIPFVGWAMAPEVGAATYAEGLAFLATAAGGWGEVPADQIAQVHKKEMILPAHLAEGIRDMIDGTAKKSDLPIQMPSAVSRASSTASGATPNAAQVSAAKQDAPMKQGDVHFNVTAVDAAGVSQFFMKHGTAIAKSLQNQNRSFVGIKAATV